MNKMSFSRVFDFPEEWRDMEDTLFASNMHRVIIELRAGMVEFGAQQAGVNPAQCELLNFAAVPVVRDGDTIALVVTGDVVVMPMVEVPNTPIVFKP